MNDRLLKLIGDKNASKLYTSKILIVGIGGVGGSAIEMIARSFINNITIVDYDTFDKSNINRQILSNINNINEYKVNEAEKRILSINDKCNIVKYNKKVDKDFLDSLEPCYDYIIDACDDVNAKILLIKYAIKNNIKIISCMGTGNKINPEMLKISNIWKTNYDPLAKKIRYLLRKEKIKYKLPVVYSDEKPILKTNGYVASISTVPNAAGIFLASYVINDILKEM